MANKPKEPKPWDRRPWPSNGDAKIDTTYAAVGHLLSTWERYEGILSILFSAFVARIETNSARKAYNAVRTFEGRAAMLQAASETYFSEQPDPPLQEQFKTLFSNAKCFSERRNDIAHGVVDYFNQWPVPEVLSGEVSYCLYPSYANYKSRDQKDAPLYCYTSVELDYFRVEIQSLHRPASDLAGSIFLRERANASRGKLRRLYRE